MSRKKQESEFPDRNEWFLPDQKEEYEKYIRGADDEELIDKETKTAIVRNELLHHKEDVTFAARSAARSEMLRTKEKGFIQSTHRIKERDILKEIPIAVQSQQFDFKLPKGPYVVDVSKDGRSVIFGGQKKHLAQFDRYNSKKLFELNTDFSIRDVTFCQNDTLNAVATSKDLYIFDKSGTQIHEIDVAKNAFGVQFLPYHFLLVAGTYERKLVYIDITSGEIIKKFQMPYEGLCIAQNQQNAVIAVGHGGGAITLWTPNASGPVAKMMRHPPAVQSIDIDITGTKLAAAHGDGNVQIWDLRNMDRVYQRRNDNPGVRCVRFSATGAMGIARNNYVEFYEKCDTRTAFLTHKYPSTVTSLKFILFEDIAIVGLQSGVSSLVVPGTGEPNLDSNVANPFATKRWRQDKEVQSLLEKLPPETIQLDPEAVFHVGPIEDKLQERKKKLLKNKMVKTVDADGSVKTEERPRSKQQILDKKLKMMKDEYNRQLIQEKEERKKMIAEGKEDESVPKGPLARFEKEKRKLL